MARLIAWAVIAILLASSVHGSDPHAAWPVFAIGAGCPLFCWLTYTAAGRIVRRRFGDALEVAAWSSVVGLVALIAVLVFVNAART